MDDSKKKCMTKAADDLCQSYKGCIGNDPFAAPEVILHDAKLGQWLKKYYLGRRVSSRTFAS